MALTLYSLFKAALLVLNALAVLHPHRFLAKRACYYGECAPRLHGIRVAPTTYSSPHLHHADGLDKVQDGTGMRAQLAGLLHAVRFMRCACLGPLRSVRRQPYHHNSPNTKPAHRAQGPSLL